MDLTYFLYSSVHGDGERSLITFISGSFATASCLVCKHKVDCEAIREDIFNQVFIHYKLIQDNTFTCVGYCVIKFTRHCDFIQVFPAGPQAYYRHCVLSNT